MTRTSLLFLSLLFHSTFAQKINVEYQILNIDQVTKSPKSQFKDTSEIEIYLSELQHIAWHKNFIEFSIDSIHMTMAITIFGDVGIKYEGITLDIDSTELQFLRRKISQRKGSLNIDDLSPDKLNKSLSEITEIYSNNGHPFCNLKIKKLEINTTDFHGELSIDRGPLVKWNKIYVKGDSSINAKFVKNLISINEGDVFSESKFTGISRIIQQTAYLAERSSPELLFTKEGAELYLYLENVPRSSVNGIIGFQPDPVTNKLNFTGNVQLKLLNVLKHGERFNLNWQSIAKQTQSLNSSLSYPYLFNTLFGVTAGFDLYKRDSTFLETNANIGVSYNLTPNRSINVFYSRSSSNILNGTFDPSAGLGTVKTNSYGLGYIDNNLDYLPNPTKGHYSDFKILGGTRNFKRQDSLSSEKDQTMRMQLTAGLFIPVLPRHIIHLENQTALYYAEEIFTNELYRFGGLLEQRGFNEDELLASSRSTFTVEYRFLLDKNSNVFAFFDMSWYERKTNTYLRDIPYGTGVGLSFSSNIGVFNLAYAIGQQMNNGFKLSNSKIHFGYSAIF